MTDAAPRNAFDDLPGELLMWVLILSELLVFGAGLTAFMAVRLTDPAGFAAAQDHLFRAGAALNTMVLVSSGFLAAQALRWRASGARAAARWALVAAAALGVVFLGIKCAEYGAKAADGIGWDTHAFFTFYYLLTGFHAAHVVAGVALLLLVAWRDTVDNIRAAGMFWHMVDLVWVLLYPVIYLLA